MKGCSSYRFGPHWPVEGDNMLGLVLELVDVLIVVPVWESDVLRPRVDCMWALLFR